MTALSYEQWKAMWDKSGPFPVITHADAHLLLTEITRLEAERDAAHSVIRQLLTGLDPMQDAQGWQRVLWSTAGNPPERETWPMTDAEAEAIRRATSTETTT